MYVRLLLRFNGSVEFFNILFLSSTHPSIKVKKKKHTRELKAQRTIVRKVSGVITHENRDYYRFLYFGVLDDFPELNVDDETGRWTGYPL